MGDKWRIIKEVAILYDLLSYYVFMNWWGIASETSHKIDEYEKQHPCLARIGYFVNKSLLWEFM